jgi:addiction module HigA family antidote
VIEMAEYTARRPNRAPTHPGVILGEDILPALGIPVTRAADELGVTRQTLHRLLRAETRITPAMAVRLGKYCGNGAAFWLRLQDAHDLWHAERELAADLQRIPDRHIAI